MLTLFCNEGCCRDALLRTGEPRLGDFDVDVVDADVTRDAGNRDADTDVGVDSALRTGDRELDRPSAVVPFNVDDDDVDSDDEDIDEGGDDVCKDDGACFLLFGRTKKGRTKGRYADHHRKYWAVITLE